MIWNAFTSNKESLISQKSAWHMSCCWSPSGKMCAVGGLSNVVTLYKDLIDDKDAGSTQKPIADMTGHTGTIFATGWFSEGEMLSGGGEGVSYIWDVERREATHKFKGHNGDVSCHDIVSKNLFVTGSNDTSSKIWDSRCKVAQQTYYTGYDLGINDIKFMPDGQSFAIATEDSYIRLYDLRSRRQVHLMSVDDHGGDWGTDIATTSLDFSATGRFCFAGYSNSMILMWDVAACQIAQQCTGHAGHKEHVVSVKMSKDGKAVASAGRDKNIFIWA